MEEMKCTACQTVPYAAFEAENIRKQRIIVGLIVGWIITILLFVGSNIAWICYESQFETVENVEEQTIHAEQEGDGGNTIVGGDYHG